jgi:hypothetical protein
MGVDLLKRPLENSTPEYAAVSALYDDPHATGRTAQHFHVFGVEKTLAFFQAYVENSINRTRFGRHCEG